MQIRPFADTDAEKLSLIFFRAVREGALSGYSHEQVAAWAPSPPDPDMYRQRRQQGRIFLVACDEAGEAVAYCDVERDGHVDHLFCMPEQMGQGIASQLYDEIERCAHANAIGRLFVEASEVARPFFLRKGFSMLKRNTILRQGVTLHNYSMDKRLD